MHTEYHCHILPGIDDGADSEKTAPSNESMLSQAEQTA